MIILDTSPSLVARVNLKSHTQITKKEQRINLEFIQQVIKLLTNESFIGGKAKDKLMELIYNGLVLVI